MCPREQLLVTCGGDGRAVVWDTTHKVPLLATQVRPMLMRPVEVPFSYLLILYRKRALLRRLGCFPGLDVGLATCLDNLYV